MNKQRVQFIMVVAAVVWVLLTVFIYSKLLQPPKVTISQVSPALNDSVHLKPQQDSAQAASPEHKQKVKGTIGVLMIGCNRTRYIRQSLKSLIDTRAQTIDRFVDRYGPLNASMQAMLKLPIVISLDCYYEGTLPVVRTIAAASGTGVRQIFLYPEARKPVPNLNKKERKLEGYYRIASHYHWAINETFNRNADIQQLIIVEEDLLFSPDFFEYFLSLAPLLATDRSLMCISAWNDNGKLWMIDRNAPEAIYRTDFFPGLGWMLQRSVWETELTRKWPRAFWDDWLRHWEQMRHRTCIRPEVSRTSTIGRKGVSKGQFFSTHLEHIRHYTGYVNFFENRSQLTHDLNVSTYERAYHSTVYQNSQEINPYRLKYIKHADTTGYAGRYRMTYYTRREFEKIADMFGLMRDFKYGVPRTAYLGVVSFVYQGHHIYLAPPITRKAYIKEW